MKHYFVITFNDLSKEKQEEIKNQLIKLLIENDGIGSVKKVEQACDRAWVELEVLINE